MCSSDGEEWKVCRHRPLSSCKHTTIIQLSRPSVFFRQNSKFFFLTFPLSFKVDKSFLVLEKAAPPCTQWGRLQMKLSLSVPTWCSAAITSVKRELVGKRKVLLWRFPVENQKIFLKVYLHPSMFYNSIPLPELHPADCLDPSSENSCTLPNQAIISKCER